MLVMLIDVIKKDQSCLMSHSTGNETLYYIVICPIYNSLL